MQTFNLSETYNTHKRKIPFPRMSIWAPCAEHDTTTNHKFEEKLQIINKNIFEEIKRQQRNEEYTDK